MAKTKPKSKKRPRPPVQTGLSCPTCGSRETEVKDSRAKNDGEVIRRRRHCPDCNSRFTSYEATTIAGALNSFGSNNRSSFTERIEAMVAGLERHIDFLRGISKPVDNNEA